MERSEGEERMMRSFLKIIAFSFFAFSVFVLFCPHISPVDYFIFSVLSLLIPVIVLINAFLLGYYMFKRSRMLIPPLCVLMIFSIKYLPATINYSLLSNTSSENSFNVLSYNVSQFARPRKYYFDRFWKGDYIMAQSRDMIDFVANHKADIKCLQEFYTDSNSVIYNATGKIAEEHGLYVVQSTKLLRINRAKFGVVIFSKFPVVNQGELIYSTNSFNRGVFADLKIGNDTIRVVNVHLESHQIKFSLSRTFLQKWNYHQIKRAEQTDHVLEFISKSPYRIILCGDLNATPFGYVYTKFKKLLSNSFERKGSGLGGTFHGRGIRFLRIDHQFFGNGIKIKGFNTLDSISFSDHYPLEGSYQIQPY